MGTLVSMRTASEPIWKPTFSAPNIWCRIDVYKRQVRDRKGETTTMELDAFIVKVTAELRNRSL